MNCSQSWRVLFQKIDSCPLPTKRVLTRSILNCRPWRGNQNNPRNGIFTLHRKKTGIGTVNRTGTIKTMGPSTCPCPRPVVIFLRGTNIFHLVPVPCIVCVMNLLSAVADWKFLSRGHLCGILKILVMDLTNDTALPRTSFPILGALYTQAYHGFVAGSLFIKTFD